MHNSIILINILHFISNENYSKIEISNCENKTMLPYQKTILKKKQHYILEKISGISDDNLPFEAFLLSSDRKKSKLKIAHSSVPQKVSKFVSSSKGIAGITGGFYELSKNKPPLDWVKIENETVQKMTKESRPCINFSKERISIDFPNEIKYKENILQAGPLLLKDGIIQSDFTEFVINSHEFESDITADRHPRTIFGFNDKYYFFLVVDGRTRKSSGLYLEECCELVQHLEFTSAINLDGGASSTLIEDNHLINHPRIKLSDKLSIPVYRSERKIPTALIIVSDNFL